MFCQFLIKPFCLENIFLQLESTYFLLNCFLPHSFIHLSSLELDLLYLRCNTNKKERSNCSQLPLIYSTLDINICMYICAYIHVLSHELTYVHLLHLLLMLRYIVVDYSVMIRKKDGGIRFLAPFKNFLQRHNIFKNHGIRISPSVMWFINANIYF